MPRPNLTLLILLLYLPVLLPAGDERETFAPLLDEISGEYIRHHVEVLGSDEMAGRATGSPGERLAADYIQAKLLEYGLSLAGSNRSYFQTIPLHGSKPLPASEMVIETAGRRQTLTLGADYVLFNTGAQTYIPQPQPLVFVGYGIAAPEFDYSDYQEMDVTDKIVVYLSGEPVSDDPTYFSGAQATVYSFAEAKERIALSRGARGAVLIPNPYEINTSWQAKTREFAFEDVRLAYSVAGIFSAMLNPLAANVLFAGAEFSLDDIFRQHQERIMHSFALKPRLSFNGHFAERDFLSRNVLAQVPGSDPDLRDSYLILSAHFDHLGLGTPVRGDSIYNGVVDNAIGVAALLEVARAIQLSPPKRSIIFLFVTGEEKGLLGSTYYLDNPAVPHHKTIANINIDGLAIFDSFNDVIGFGTELSTLGDILHDTASRMGLTVSALPAQFSRVESFARSDQVAFANAGIPAALVMDGTSYAKLSELDGLKKHLYWMQNIYHSPFDDFAQPIDWLAAEEHGRLLLAFAWATANAKTAPQWLPGSPYITARLQSIAEKK